MTPTRYLYLVSEDTDRVLAIFPIDDMRELDVITLEGRIRTEHNVDDPESGLVLRDSRLTPLTAEEVRAAQENGA